MRHRPDRPIRARDLLKFAELLARDGAGLGEIARDLRPAVIAWRNGWSWAQLLHLARQVWRDRPDGQ